MEQFNSDYLVSAENYAETIDSAVLPYLAERET